LPEDNKAIQMVSALVLQLIQCCPSLVKLAIVGTKKGIDLEPQKPQADGESAVTVSDANSYEAAAACALAFMKSFVAKYVNPVKAYLLLVLPVVLYFCLLLVQMLYSRRRQRLPADPHKLR
jgi:Flp pilus assembly protein TadB